MRHISHHISANASLAPTPATEPGKNPPATTVISAAPISSGKTPGYAHSLDRSFLRTIHGDQSLTRKPTREISAEAPTKNASKESENAAPAHRYPLMTPVGGNLGSDAPFEFSFRRGYYLYKSPFLQQYHDEEKAKADDAGRSTVAQIPVKKFNPDDKK